MSFPKFGCLIDLIESPTEQSEILKKRKKRKKEILANLYYAIKFIFLYKICFKYTINHFLQCVFTTVDRRNLNSESISCIKQLFSEFCNDTKFYI